MRFDGGRYFGSPNSKTRTRGATARRKAAFMVAASFRAPIGEVYSVSI
jgi:hypothetical protein